MTTVLRNAFDSLIHAALSNFEVDLDGQTHRFQFEGEIDAEALKHAHASARAFEYAWFPGTGRKRRAFLYFGAWYSPHVVVSYITLNKYVAEVDLDRWLTPIQGEMAYELWHRIQFTKQDAYNAVRKQQLLATMSRNGLRTGEHSVLLGTYHPSRQAFEPDAASIIERIWAISILKHSLRTVDPDDL